METKLINFTIPKKLLRKIDAFAKKEERSRSELLREAIRVYLKKRKQRGEDFAAIRKSAEEIDLPEDEAMALVDRVRRSLPMNQ